MLFLSASILMCSPSHINTERFARCSFRRPGGGGFCLLLNGGEDFFLEYFLCLPSRGDDVGGSDAIVVRAASASRQGQILSGPKMVLLQFVVWRVGSEV